MSGKFDTALFERAATSEEARDWVTTVLQDARPAIGGMLLNSAEASVFPLSRWIEALVVFSAWLEARELTAPLEDQIAYLECCAAAAGPAGALEDLPALLQEMLETHGCEAALGRGPSTACAARTARNTGPMADAETTLSEIKERVLAFAKERDWEQFHSPKNLSMAIAAEAAELMEHFLWQSAEQSRTDLREPNLRAKVEEELADVLIFAIEFANVCGIDLSRAITRKMKRNAEKYPVEKARGRSDKYTEL